MTLRLTVADQAWRAHLAAVRDEVHGLVPVVKGNGYGLGRSRLADTASAFAAAIAVGTVHELHDVGAERFDEVLVLTPALQLPAGLAVGIPVNTVLTVGNQAHVDALVTAGWRGPVNVKIASAMHRYGVEPGDLAAFIDLVHRSGLEPRRALFHPPLVTAQHTADDVVAAIEAWLAHLDPALTVSTSHLDPAAFTRLAAANPDRRFELRLGTALWHGDKSMLHLDADVLDIHPVSAGTPAGYRGDPVPADGTLVMIGAGSAHGVAPLADGRSPFHFARRRLSLHEAPHMHTSMAFVPDGEPCPSVGDRVDVQRPLITTAVDEVVWA
jgi:alanine racemase